MAAGQQKEECMATEWLVPARTRVSSYQERDIKRTQQQQQPSKHQRMPQLVCTPRGEMIEPLTPRGGVEPSTDLCVSRPYTDARAQQVFVRTGPATPRLVDTTSFPTPQQSQHQSNANSNHAAGLIAAQQQNLNCHAYRVPSQAFSMTRPPAHSESPRTHHDPLPSQRSPHGYAMPPLGYPMTDTPFQQSSSSSPSNKPDAASPSPLQRCTTHFYVNPVIQQPAHKEMAANAQAYSIPLTQKSPQDVQSRQHVALQQQDHIAVSAQRLSVQHLPTRQQTMDQFALYPDISTRQCQSPGQTEYQGKHSMTGPSQQFQHSTFTTHRQSHDNARLEDNRGPITPRGGLSIFKQVSGWFSASRR